MRRILIVPVIAGILLTLSACGAKEETTSTSPTTQASAKSGESDSSSTTEKKSSTTESEDDTTDVTEDDSGTGGIGDLPTGLDGDCMAVSTLYAGAMAQAGAVFNPSGTSDADLEKLSEEFEKAKADVPDEIADAFDVWSDAWSQYMTALDGMSEGGMTDPANLEKLEQATEILDAPEVEAASKEIEAYIEKECSGVGGLVPDE
jgi:hypothetical protein